MKTHLLKSISIVGLFFLSISCAKKSDPSPSTPETTCKLSGSTQTSGTGSSASTNSTSYTYNTSGQIATISYSYTSGTQTPSITTQTFEYDNSGKVSKAVTSSSSNTTLEYNNGVISKANSFNNNTLSGYAIYSQQGSVYTIDNYTSQNIKNYSQSYTITGSNFTASSATSYNSVGQISYFDLTTYSNFDDKLSPSYILYLNIPGFGVFVGSSRNNPLNSSSTSTSYTNGIATNTSTSTTTYSYTYNSSGAPTKSIQTRISGSSSNVSTTDYTYSNCN